ncbi:MAG: hypothetical protein NUV80_06575 [Candidatus Berkelbacteria bacterium]|nr:hypothetical protein [Candidatus Berkelbacteria bacterium]
MKGIVVAFDWQQISHDFQQKYEKTFVRVKLDSTFEVFWVHKVCDGIPPYIILSNARHGEIQLNHDTEFEFSFDYPNIGYFNYKDQMACLFFKRFERQWKRGISNETAQIVTPYDYFYKVTETKLSEKLLEDAFDTRVTRSISAAINLLKNRLSVSLNNYFAIGLHVKSLTDTYLLWYSNVIIGEIVKDQIFLREPQFYQEIRDYMRDVGEYLNVVI